MARVVSGVDQTGEVHDEPNVARDLRLLDIGRKVRIPDDRKSDGFRDVWLKVWVLLFSGDYLGAQSMLPFIESPKAHLFCRGCNYDARSQMAGRPFSFLRDYMDGPPFVEREWADLKANLDRLRAGVGKKELKKAYHDLGLNKLYFALDPEYIPHIDPVLVAPQDLLHLFPDGLLRSELAWLMYVLLKFNHFTLAKLNTRIKEYRGLPLDVRIPPFPDKLKKGIAGGKPDSSSTARLTGSQCMHFTLESIKIIDPLLNDEIRANPAWISWVKLVELFTHSVQHKMHCDDLELIDDLVLEHSRLFDEVPEYNGLKRPKHHFLSHLVMDIWRFGPPRGYWCFGYEGFNRVIKDGAKRSNWKNVTLSIMRYWSARSARSLMYTSY